MLSGSLIYIGIYNKDSERSHHGVDGDEGSGRGNEVVGHVANNDKLIIIIFVGNEAWESVERLFFLFAFESLLCFLLNQFLQSIVEQKTSVSWF